MPTRTPVRVAAPESPAVVGLLRQAAAGVADAELQADPLARYAGAHLAALRAAAAVLAARAQPTARRGSRSAWRLLPAVAPELSEWAAFFAACSSTRAAAEAGIRRLVSDRDADDMVRQSRQFLAVTSRLLLPQPR